MTFPGPLGDDPLVQALGAVSRFLVAEQSLGDTLHLISTMARDAVEATAVGLTLLDDRDRPTTAVFTSDISPEVDQAQYDDGSGPCVDSCRLAVTVRVDDTSQTADRWPAFSRRAVAAGIRSTLALPLVAAGHRYGAMNCYSREPAGFVDTEAALQVYATQASVVIANARSYWAAVDLGQNLARAMESRATIEQAKGVLMASKGCSPDEAFGLLVQASQTENVKLRVVAERVVAAASGGIPDSSGPAAASGGIPDSSGPAAADRAG